MKALACEVCSSRLTPRQGSALGDGFVDLECPRGCVAFTVPSLYATTRRACLCLDCASPCDFSSQPDGRDCVACLQGVHRIRVIPDFLTTTTEGACHT